ncbi:unnamed protein product [Urochloa humidicola]
MRDIPSPRARRSVRRSSSQPWCHSIRCSILLIWPRYCATFPIRDLTMPRRPMWLRCCQIRLRRRPIWSRSLGLRVEGLDQPVSRDARDRTVGEAGQVAEDKREM